MNPEIFTTMEAAAPRCTSWGCLRMLALLGRAGTAGRTTEELADAAALSTGGTTRALRLLLGDGLLTAPQKGNGKRRGMYRWTIAPAGLAVLLTQPAAIPTMKPLALTA